MLPEPTLSFTLPSIHDSTTLDCRVFHPYSLSPSLKAPPWRKHAAIIAHPYAPLGGCYDDHVVDGITVRAAPVEEGKRVQICTAEACSQKQRQVRERMCKSWKDAKAGPPVPCELCSSHMADWGS